MPGVTTLTVPSVWTVPWDEHALNAVEMQTAEIRINLSVRMVHAAHVPSSPIKAVTPQIQFVLKAKMERRHVDHANRIGNVLGVVMNASMGAVKSVIWPIMQAA